MKIPSLLLSASLLVALSTPLSAQVYSNIVGFQEIVNKPGKLDLVGNPWANSTNNLATVIGDQVVGGDTLTNGDAVWFWDKDNTQYKKFFLGANIGEGFDDVWLDENYEASTEIVDPGEGFWLVNNSSVTNNVILTGDVVTNLNITVTIQEGVNLLAYPFSADVAVSNLNINATGGDVPSSSDAIWVWNSEESQYVKYFYGAGIGAGFDNFWLDENYEQVTEEIKAGQGFWYVRQTGLGDIPWSEDRPYDPFAP